MDVRYREKLQHNADVIIDEIDAEHVCLYLNGTVLTSFEVDKVYAVKSRQERARRLLNLIMTKDTLAYQHFRYALRERYSDIVRKLDNTAVCTNSDNENGEFEQKLVLKRRDSLVLNIQTEELVDYMKQEGALTNDDCNRIRAGASKEDKARIMVDSLSDKGPQAYKTLSLAIRARQPKLAKIFEKTD